MKELISAIRGGAAVVTVNARLASYVTASFGASMKEVGRGGWPTPRVVPFSAWLGELYALADSDRPALSEARRAALWRKIVSRDFPDLSDDEVKRPGPGPGAFSRAAASSYALMVEYGVPFESHIYLTDESRALKRWSVEYDSELTRLGFTDPSALGRQAAALIKDGSVEAPERVVFAGFDEASTTLEIVIDALESVGTHLSFWPRTPHRPGEAVDVPTPAREISIRVFDDELNEVRQAARWARTVSAPGVTVGFVVPDLARYRCTIEREFAAELDPASALPWKLSPRVFNISLAPMLTEEPLVSAALSVISTDERPVPTDSLWRLLASPYIGGTSGEYLAIASIDASLKRDNRLTVSVAGFLRRAKDVPVLEEFSKRLVKWLRSMRGGALLPSRWAASFDKLLKGLGWPGQATLSSREFQAASAWKELLDTLSTFDDMLGELTRAEAASHLSALAQATPHQAETKSTPIQVLGLLESSGMEFDHLWIMGAHEDSFPEKASPDPFIPFGLQRRFKLPGATSERCLEFARVTSARLVASTTGELVVSSPAVVDSKEVRVSPIYGHMPKVGADDFVPTRRDSRFARTVQRAARLEDRPPGGGGGEEVAVTEEERRLTGRSTSVLKDQSACPFRAFAVHRLGAASVATPEPGLTLMDRGTIVHAALGVFWKEAGGFARLLELSEGGELAASVAAAVETALRETAKVESGRFFDLEKGRVARLVRRWLEEVEMERAPFTVKEVEAERTITVGGLDMGLRIDRIDTIGDGGEVLIDYKTGRCSRDDWLGPRPRDPQMPLYAVSGVFDAVAFGRLSLKGTRFEGTARTDALPGVKPFSDDRWTEKIEGAANWDEFMEKLKETTDALGVAFMRGSAEVDPLGFGTRDTACMYCEVKPLCRVFEVGGAGGEAGASGAGGEEDE